MAVVVVVATAAAAAVEDMFVLLRSLLLEPKQRPRRGWKRERGGGERVTGGGVRGSREMDTDGDTVVVDAADDDDDRMTNDAVFRIQNTEVNVSVIHNTQRTSRRDDRNCRG